MLVCHLLDHVVTVMHSWMRRPLWRGGLALLLLTAANLRAAGPHYVFAHYMVCFATYGQSLQGYTREIKQAQAAGLDGFVLDVGAWETNSYYRDRVKLIYDAADQLNSGFKLTFFIEFPELTNIVDLVRTYGNRQPTLRSNSRVVLSSWGMNDVPSLGWVGLNWTNILNSLRAAGYPVFFIPHFWPDGAPELPTYADAQNLLSTNATILDGLFLFGAAGLPYQLAQCNSNYTAAVHAAGKTFMASVTPNYWGNLQPTAGRRYFETQGGEGLDLQWNSIIANQPDWVNIVTWSDFHESTYVSPIDDPGLFTSVLTTPHRYSHAGYLEFSKFYISWFKSGHKPSIDHDALFYFYRTHPKNAVAANTNDVPVTALFGDVQDVIYTSVFLTAPAQLEISSGGRLTTNSLPAGLTHSRTPFVPGPQKFTLRRSGRELVSLQGPDILAQIQVYDFFPGSDFAYSPPYPPTNVRVSGK